MTPLALLARVDLASTVDRLVAADLLEEAGRDVEAKLLRNLEALPVRLASGLFVQAQDAPVLALQYAVQERLSRCLYAYGESYFAAVADDDLPSGWLRISRSELLRFGDGAEILRRLRACSCTTPSVVAKALRRLYARESQVTAHLRASSKVVYRFQIRDPEDEEVIEVWETSTNAGKRYRYTTLLDDDGGPDMDEEPYESIVRLMDDVTRDLPRGTRVVPLPLEP